MNKILHNSWFWFGVAMLVLYLVLVELVLPKAVEAVMSGFTVEPALEPTSIFVEPNTGLQSEQGYILQPAYNVQGEAGTQ